MDRERKNHVFRMFGPARKGLAGLPARWTEAVLGRLLGLSTLDRTYRELDDRLFGHDFIRQAMRALNLAVKVEARDLERVPAKGPLAVVANHPFGGPEGLALAEMLLSGRPDVKILANGLLGRFSELSDLILPVAVSGGPEAARANLATMRRCLEHLRQGGALGIFPAGEVSRASVVEGRPAVTDRAWSASVARLIRQTGATTLPVYFHGRNSPLFQIVARLCPSLGTALLPRELLRRAGRPIAAEIGEPIPFERLKRFHDGRPNQDQVAARYLRKRVLLLEHRFRRRGPRLSLPGLRPSSRAPLETIPAISPAVLDEEIAALPPDSLLLETGNLAVHCAGARFLPNVLREIGRLREIAFRAAGEGTGKPLDLDVFDACYEHLFLWDRQTSEIVGAYRVGRSDELLERFGTKGLYVNTLFKLRPDFLRRIGPALEMGRSFVRPERQKSYAPLLTLWKGLAAYVCRHPKYRCLFGPVSVSNDYQRASRSLIARYFEERSDAPELARLVKPRAPLRDPAWRRKAFRSLAADVDDLQALLRDLETDEKGLPVLLRQYLKLGGRVLAFNVDKDFADALDGLIVVDLLQTDRRQLERYMGREGLETFLAFHGRAEKGSQCA